jgi:hypothetical protein
MNEEVKIKQIPYGVSDFKKFRESNNYFVDKTWYLRDIEKKGSYLFLIRPRRFGKSLFLSIMESYYDIAYKDQFDHLFIGTDIHQKPTGEKNNYMIFKLNFSSVNAKISMVEDAFLTCIKNSAYDFVTKYNKYLEIDISKAEMAFNSKKSASEVMDTFLNYCLRKEPKLYVIIDEYDNFANTILSDHGEHEFQKITHSDGFLRSFFNVIKAGTTGTDAPISRLFMTGVSPITLDDVTSGFNIASNISLDSDINEILGFNKSEVETMIEYYRRTGKIRHSTPGLMAIMSHWYNHYRFALRATSEVFNTVHVLYFMQEYMKESEIPSILVDENVRFDYNKLRHFIIIDKEGKAAANGNFSQLREIIETGSVHSNIARSFPIKKRIDPENFTSLLYYFGLLTIGGVDEEKKAILKIPNESIRRLYYDFIVETYEETGLLTIKLSEYDARMKEMAFNGNWKPLIEYLVEQMDVSMGIRDLITGEKSIQAFLNVYLGLSRLYLISSEKELKKGFADLVMEPFLAQYPAIKYSYLIEIKYIKPSEAKNPKSLQTLLKPLKGEAETQLKQYGMDEKFRESIGNTTLKKLVLIFNGSRLVFSNEI